MQDFSLSVHALSICSPFTGCIENAYNHAEMVWDKEAQIADWQPEMDFLPKRTFRRLSRLSKMSLYVAHSASQSCSDLNIGAPIFCSRYGEFQHTYEVLKAIQCGELVSPMNFSYSVHNTGQGLFSILHNDIRPATVLSSRNDTIEHALCKAYAQLHNKSTHSNDAALIVYADDNLPAPFLSLLKFDVAPLAFAMIVTKSELAGDRSIKLSMKPTAPSAVDISSEPAETYKNAHECNILNTLSGSSKTLLSPKGRLQWEWFINES